MRQQGIGLISRQQADGISEMSAGFFRIALPRSVVAQSEMGKDEIRFEIKSAPKSCDRFLDIPLFLKNGRAEVMQRRVELVGRDRLLRPIAGLTQFAGVRAGPRDESGNPGRLFKLRTAFEFGDRLGVMPLLE